MNNRFQISHPRSSDFGWVIFLLMNYSKIYQDLIWKRKVYQRLDKTQAGENHHIVPLSEGGLDTKNNIVRLTIKEHIFAHQLLARIWNDGKMWCAAHWMMVTRENTSNKNMRLAAIAREKRNKKLSEVLKGKKKPPMTDEHKRKISEALKNMSEETKRKISESVRGSNHPNFGKQRSEETRRKIASSLKGKTRPGMKGKHWIIGADGKRHWV